VSKIEWTMGEKVHRERMEIRVDRQYDILDKLWNRKEGLLIGRKRKARRHGRNNRQFINAVFWILRIGAPLRDLPPNFGDWKTSIAGSATKEIAECGRNWLTVCAESRI
jgi:transposase